MAAMTRCPLGLPPRPNASATTSACPADADMARRVAVLPRPPPAHPPPPPPAPTRYWQGRRPASCQPCTPGCGANVGCCSDASPSRRLCTLASRIRPRHLGARNCACAFVATTRTPRPPRPRPRPRPRAATARRRRASAARRDPRPPRRPPRDGLPRRHSVRASRVDVARRGCHDTQMERQDARPAPPPRSRGRSVSNGIAEEHAPQWSPDRTGDAC